MNTETKEQIKNDLQAYVARIGSGNAASKSLVNVSNATISNILNNKWDNIAEAMWLNVQKQVAVSLDGWVIVPNTKRFQLISGVYNDAKQFSEVFCIVAPEGSGKTEPAKLCVQYNRTAYVVKCSEHWNKRTFLAELLRAMGKESGGSIHEMMSEVLDTILKTDKPLIIIDEADKLTDQVLYFFISIYNETEDKCGMVLQATDHLKKRILKGVRMNKKGYKEIYSRIGRKFVELPANAPTDLYAIAAANGISEEAEQVRIANESEGDIRRIKRLVKAYLRKERRTA